jgi:hypothetical protein
LKPVPTGERIQFLADLACQLAQVADGESVEFKSIP